MTKCPCEECISFAICYNQESICCVLLYNFICKSDREVNWDKFKGYIPNRAEAIYALYKRYILYTEFSTDRVVLSRKGWDNDGMSHQELLTLYIEDHMNYGGIGTNE